MNKSKIVALAAVLVFSVNAFAEKVKNFSIDDEEVMTQDEAMKKVAELKQKLAEFAHANSLGGVTLDVLTVSGMGLLIGSLVGFVEGLVSCASLSRGEEGNNYITGFHVLSHVGVQALAGVNSGFWLSLAGQVGSLPQYKKKNLAFILTLQSGFVALATYIFDQSFISAIEGQEEGERNARLLVSAVFSTLPAAAIGLVPLIAECIIVYKKRNALDLEKNALEKSLKKLVKALDKISGDDELVKISREFKA